MKRKVIFIILIFFIMIFLFSIYHFLFINKVSVKIDDVYYLVNKNEVKVNANKDYRYDFFVSDDSIAGFNHASLNGKTAVNYLNIKKKGNIVIKINTYNNGKLIKTIEKNIIACGKLEDDLNLKTIYNIDIGEELTLFDKNDVCLQSVSLSVDNNVAMLIDNNRLWGISQGNNKLSIIRGIEKISSDIIVGRAKEISVTGITLKNNNFSLMVGQNAKIEPIIKPSNASNQALLYESSNNNVATVSNDGEIKAKIVGKCEIIVKTVDGNYEARASIDVYDNNKKDNKNIVLNKTNVSLKVGDKLELQASYEPKSSIITWISDNVNVADVTNNGIVTAKGIGSTTITAKIDEETYATCKIEVKNNNVNVSSISVTPNNATLKIGDTITLSKTILPSNATNQSVTWSSSNPSVVTVSSNGVVTALSSGTAVITVTTVDGKKTARANINVLSDNISVTGISITPSSISLEVGKTSSISYIITPSNATNKSVTWSSSNSTVATVSSSGVVTGLSIGTATILVTTIDGGKQAYATVNVVGNTINPSNDNYIGPTSSNNIYAKYESTTLKYWIEKPKSTYVITHVWVNDAYNQFKTAIPNGKLGSLANASTILNREISSKGYSNKGLVAFNASAFVGNGHNSDYSSAIPAYNNSSVTPIVILDGKVLRNLTDKVLPNDSRKTYGLTRSGYLSYYTFSKTNISTNQLTAQQIINDGVRYTFGFTPVLIYYGSISTSSTSTNNMRQALCQIDKNNFAIYTSLNTSDKPTHLDVAQILRNIGCQTAFALDGSESVSGYYKTDSSSVKTLRSSGRSVADIIYFVEQ